MALKFQFEDGETPLTAEEADGLLEPHIQTRGQLNEWESVNVAAGRSWALRTRRKDIFNEAFCRTVHRRMFDETWAWAGQFRNTDRNIGVPWTQIAVDLTNLLEDATFWFQRKPETFDASLALFHHRLVSIHPFPNGNGRHGRLMTDVVAKFVGAPDLSWGSSPKQEESTVRARYIDAMRAGDRRQYQPLTDFIRG